MEEDLEDLSKLVGDNSTMDAYEKALATAGRGFDKKQAFRKKHRRVAEEIEEAKKQIQQESVSPKTRELIEEAKKQIQTKKQVPSVTAQAIQAPEASTVEAAEPKKPIFKRTDATVEQAAVSKPTASKTPPDPVSQIGTTVSVEQGIATDKIEDQVDFVADTEPPLVAGLVDVATETSAPKEASKPAVAKPRSAEIPKFAAKQVTKSTPNQPKQVTAKKSPEITELFPKIEVFAAKQDTKSTAAPKPKEKKHKSKQTVKSGKPNIPAIPKIQVSRETVDQAVGLASKSAGFAINAASVIAKESVALASQFQANLNTTMVDDTDMTYQEALGKVTKATKGVWKVCAVLGGAIRDTVTFFAKEVQKKRSKEEEPSVRPTRSISSSSTLDDSEALLKAYNAAAATTTVNPEENTMPPSVPTPTTQKTTAPTPIKTGYFDQSLEGVKSTAGSAWGKLVSSASSAMENVTATAETKVSGIQDTLKKSKEGIQDKLVQAEEVQSKAGFMLGKLFSSASDAVEDVAAKAKDEREKLQTFTEQTKKKGVDYFSNPVRENKQPKTSKVVKAKKAKKDDPNKGSPFFLDSED